MRPTDIIAVSRSQAVDMARKLTYPTIIISIDDPGEPPIDFRNRPDLLGVLNARFADTDAVDAYAISLEDAEEILDFVQPYVEQTIQIVVHCYEGRSRSAGVAAALQELIWGYECGVFDDWKYTPNMKCYQTVLQAALGEGWEEDKTKRHRRNFWYRIACENGLLE